ALVRQAAHLHQPFDHLAAGTEHEPVAVEAERHDLEVDGRREPPVELQLVAAVALARGERAVIHRAAPRRLLHLQHVAFRQEQPGEVRFQHLDGARALGMVRGIREERALLFRPDPGRHGEGAPQVLSTLSRRWPCWIEPAMLPSSSASRSSTWSSETTPTSGPSASTIGMLRAPMRRISASRVDREASSRTSTGSDVITSATVSVRGSTSLAITATTMSRSVMTPTGRMRRLSASGRAATR